MGRLYTGSGAPGGHAACYARGVSTFFDNWLRRLLDWLTRQG
jgi:hypothetical protein